MLRILLLLSLILTGCQSNPNKNRSEPKKMTRLPSTSSPLLRTFIRELANGSEHSAVAIERAAVRFMKEVDDRGYGNWEQMGLTKEEAMKVNSMYDNLPFMSKARGWVQNNAHRMGLRIKPTSAEKAYKAMMTGRRIDNNPYSSEAIALSDRLARAQGRLKPTFTSVAVAERRASLEVSELRKIGRNLPAAERKELALLEGRYKKNLVILSKRGKVTPSASANGVVITDSATKITKVTGRKAMGEGCDDFLEIASEATLSRKASIDQVWAERVIDKAIQKARREIASFDELPPHLRLTQLEVNDELVEAFRVLNGLDESEARLVLKRLQNGPCNIYPR